MRSSKAQKNHKSRRSTKSGTKAAMRSATRRLRNEFTGVTFPDADAMKKFIVPGAAVVGSSVLAATGLILKDQLRRLARAAVKSAVAGGASARDGVARQRHSVMGTSLAVFAGLLAGSALMAFLGPLLKDQFEARIGPHGSSEQPAMSNAVHGGASM
jgi:hypothetical protein